jgi:hypothetical protein
VKVAFSSGELTMKPQLHWSEVAKNIVSAVGILGAIWIWYVWSYQRSDRAFDVITKLEERFDSEGVRTGRDLVDDDKDYRSIKIALSKYVDGKADGIQSIEKEQASDVDRIDDLLRFYELLSAVRSEHQVKDDVLSASFAYYLEEYYNPNRIEFRQYVDRYYKNLKAWLDTDLKGSGPHFFNENEFNR